MSPKVRQLTPVLLLVLLAASGSVRAASVIDLGTIPAPTVPTDIERGNQPYYITNTTTDPASGAVDYFRVGEGARLHLGYGNIHVASGDVAVSVDSDMTVMGSVFMGKYATPDATGIPELATSRHIDLHVNGTIYMSGGTLAASAASTDYSANINVDGDLVMDRGSNVVLQGAGPGPDGKVGLSASTISVKNSTINLHDYSVLTTTDPSAPTSDGTNYALRLAEGGVLTLNGGTPPENPSDPWEFRGVNVGYGGDGLLVERGGVLRTGKNGGYIRGSLGQRLWVEAGGALDASKGRLTTFDFDDVYLGGSYLAGYNRISGVITRLDASDSAVQIAETAHLGMSIDLQRALNNTSVLAQDNSTIMRAGDIHFATGAPPTLKTGMGVYGLRTDTDLIDNKTSLWIEKVDRAVVGDGTATDKELFRNNMEDLWRPGRMSSEQAGNIYGLSVADIPTIEAYGQAGQLNRDVLESLVNGKNQPVADRGIADAGLFEMYNASPMFGVNTVAYNTASEVIATVGERLDHIDTELASGAGYYYETSSALPMFNYQEPRDTRFWVGGFGRREEADLDYGVSGYKYEPRGMAMGYDRLLGSFALGGALTYGKGDYRDKAANASDSEIESYSASLYAAYHGLGGFKASAHASYSHLENDLSDVRGGMRRTADHDSRSWSVGGKIGYDLNPVDRMTLSPTIGLTHIRAVNEDHDETLDGVGVMRIGSVRRNSTLLPLDLAMGYDVYHGSATLLRLTTTLGYAYDFDDDGMTGTFDYLGLGGASAMPTAKRAPGRHRFNFGAGLFWSGSRLDLMARYDYYRRADQDAHQVRGNLGVKF